MKYLQIKNLKRRVGLTESEYKKASKYKWRLTPNKLVITNVKLKTGWTSRTWKRIMNSEFPISKKAREKDASGIKRTSKTGYRGVSPVTIGNTFTAQIYHKRQYIYLGCFKDPVKAAKAYDKAAKKYHKNKAKLNFPS